MLQQLRALFARTLEKQTPVIEPLLVIATLSLLTSWAIQPYITHALLQQGAIVQDAAQTALWISGVLSPFAAFGKAFCATLVCWACGIFLDVRVPLSKLLSLFCIAEVWFSARDVAMWAVLATRGIESVHTTADLAVLFGLSSFVQSSSAIAKIAIQSWDFFTFTWALLAFWMLRAAFKMDARSSACFAAIAFAVRVLFTAATQLYTI